MAFLQITEVGLKKTGKRVAVPNDPKAKLMYYLDCICSVLKLDDGPDINRLRCFKKYNMLTQEDTNVLVGICLLLKPDVLLNKCIFQNDELCGDSPNKFFDLETVRNNVLVAGSVLIGGQHKRVTKIMTFTMKWLHENWLDPMQILSDSQRPERERQERERQERESQEKERQKKERQEKERQNRLARQEKQRQELEKQKLEIQDRRNEEWRIQKRQRQEIEDAHQTCIIL